MGGFKPKVLHCKLFNSPRDDKDQEMEAEILIHRPIFICNVYSQRRKQQN